MNSCAKHSHEMGVELCRRCGGSWCSDCLVYSFGPKKPPYCMGCAMVAGGVRTAGARPAMPKRELKALQKAAKAEQKAAARAAKDVPEQDREEGHVAAASEVALPAATPDAPPASGWEQPWWEDRQPTFAD